MVKKEHEVATQRNDLIHGQQSLSLVQKRIFALTVQQIRKGDEDYQTYEVDIEDLVAAGTSRNVFSRIEDEADNLMRKILLKKEEIEGSEHPKTTRWSMVSKAEHNPGTGKLKIDLHPDIRDMLLDLKGKFTRIPVSEIMACRSTYGQRMYELLYSVAWKGSPWETSVKELRFSLDAVDKYPNFSHFRSRILEKAQKDIQKNTNMNFTWEEESRGKGRKITHLIFDFEIVPDQLDLPLESEPALPKFEPKFNLDNRLKNNAKLSKKQLHITLKWLSNNQDQQWPMAYWMAKQVEVDTPTDGNDNAIREINKWAWARIEEAMENGSFPEPEKSPEEIQQMSEEELQKDIPGYDPNNRFNYMRPD